MTSLRFNIDRVTIIGLALAATLPFLAVSPVRAAPADCAAEAQLVREQAATATPAAAQKALRSARVAEKICQEGNRHEAARKFAQARQLLDQPVQMASQR